MSKKIRVMLRTRNEMDDCTTFTLELMKRLDEMEPELPEDRIIEFKEELRDGHGIGAWNGFQIEKPMVLNHMGKGGREGRWVHASDDKNCPIYERELVFFVGVMENDSGNPNNVCVMGGNDHDIDAWLNGGLCISLVSYMFVWEIPPEDDLLGQAWELIRDAFNDDWDDAPRTWREAAESWRQNYESKAGIKEILERD